MNKNALYFGDNLDVLRESVASVSVDLIYLDPPFNSARDYNILFASPKGQSSEAQITARPKTTAARLIWRCAISTSFGGGLVRW